MVQFDYGMYLYGSQNLPCSAGIGILKTRNSNSIRVTALISALHILDVRGVRHAVIGSQELHKRSSMTSNNIYP